jgi:hypothetical protein
VSITKRSFGLSRGSLFFLLYYLFLPCPWPLVAFPIPFPVPSCFLCPSPSSALSLSAVAVSPASCAFLKATNPKNCSWVVTLLDTPLSA